MSEVYIAGVRYVPEVMYDGVPVPLSEALVSRRKLRCETLDFAARNMGIAKSQLWSLEQGKTEPKLGMLQVLLRYYAIPFEQLAAVDTGGV